LGGGGGQEERPLKEGGVGAKSPIKESEEKANLSWAGQGGMYNAL